MLLKKLFGNTVEPACMYCAHGFLSSDKSTVLCRKLGVTDAFFHCGHYRYDPLKRTPHERPALPKYDPSDFSL